MRNRTGDSPTRRTECDIQSATTEYSSTNATNGTGRPGQRRGARAWRLLALAAVAALALAGFGLVSSPMARAAATTTIPTCDYATLAGAVTNAASGDTLQFGCDGVITFPQTITISKTLTINGNGRSVTLSGGGGRTVFAVQTNGDLTLDGLMVRGGSASSGGGVYNDGTLAIENSTFSSNWASYGAGVYNASGGVLTIENSTFAGNAADPGAGMGSEGGAVFSQGALTITNSTFLANQADFGGAVFNQGALSITNSAINGNLAWGFGAPEDVVGGGVWNDGSLTIKSSIVANNLEWARYDVDNCAGYGAITDGGYNLTNTSGSCPFWASTDVRTDSPGLDPKGLWNNGGLTQTVALLVGSPAIDRIPVGVNGCGGAIITDQRGIARPQGAKCDIGPFEVVQDATPPTITITMPAGLQAPDDPANTTSYYAYQQSYMATYTCADNEGGSGVAECNGTTETSGQVALDTASVGKKTLNITASDKAGNMVTTTRIYNVIYEWSGVLQPVNADGSSLFKLGSTVPVKFQLTGASASFNDAVVRIYATKLSDGVVGTVVEPESNAAPDNGNTFRYDETSQQYIYNLSTKGDSFSAGTWKLMLYVGGDNTTGALLGQVNISLK